MDSKEARRRAKAAYWRKVDAMLAKGEISRGAFATLHRLMMLSEKHGWEHYEIQMGERQMAQAALCDRKTLRNHRRTLEKAKLVTFAPRQDWKKRGFWSENVLKIAVENSEERSGGIFPPESGGISTPESGGISTPESGGISPPLIINLSRRDNSLKKDSRDLKVGEDPARSARRMDGGKSSSLRSEYGLDPETDCETPLGRSPLGGSTGSNGAAFRGDTRKTETETETLGRIRALVGRTVMETDAGKWRNRIRANPGRVLRAIADAESFVKSGGTMARPGGYLEKLWRMFE